MSVHGYYNNSIPSEKLERLVRCWEVLLQPSSQLRRQQEILGVKLDLVNQRVVNMDVLRTRMNLFTPQLMQLLEKLLTYFCKSNQLVYKQGINEIMAPFLAWKKLPGVQITTVYDCFDWFFRTHLLNLYFDEQFNSLELLFRLITIILKYHDPSLARFLSQNDITPQLYSTAWFMTLFANKLSLQLVYMLWQVYILEQDQFFIFFLIVGLLLYNKHRLFQVKECQLPQYVTQLNFNGPDQLAAVLQIAMLVRKFTPKSLFMLCKQKKLFQRCQDYKYIRSVLNNIEKINLCLIQPQELVDSVYNSSEICYSMGCKGSCYFCRINTPLDIWEYEKMIGQQSWFRKILNLTNDIRGLNNRLKFVVVDIRLKKERMLVQSQLIDIRQPIQKSQQLFFQKYLLQRGKIHFVFLFTRFRFDDLEKCDEEELLFCKRFIQMLYSAGFQHMSILEGGFDELQKTIRLQMTRANQSLKPKNSWLQSSSMLRSLQSIALPQHTEYYQNNGIENPINLPLLPSLLYGLERLSQNSQCIISAQSIFLFTQTFCIIFKNNKLLQDLLAYVKNNKSLTQYYLSGLKSNRVEETLEVDSVFFLKDMEKLSTKESTPGLLLIYFKVYKILEENILFSKHIGSLSSKYLINYLINLQDSLIHHIYQDCEKREFRLVRKSIKCQQSQLNSHVHHIKYLFSKLASQYKTFLKSLK